MSDNEIILAEVDKILAQQPPQKIWGADEHIHLLAKVVQHEIGDEIIQKEELSRLKEIFRANGLGGNASQFRQWLASDKGGKRIEAKAAVLARTYAD